MGSEAFINSRKSKLVLDGFNFLPNQEKYPSCRAVLCGLWRARWNSRIRRECNGV